MRHISYIIIHVYEYLCIFIHIYTYLCMKNFLPSKIEWNIHTRAFRYKVIIFISMKKIVMCKHKYKFRQ